MWPTLQIFSMHCTSCGIYFPSITVWNNVLLFNWSPWLRCFFTRESFENPFIKACTCCVNVTLCTEAKLLITLVQRAGGNLYIYFQCSVIVKKHSLQYIHNVLAVWWHIVTHKWHCAAGLHSISSRLVIKISNCFFFFSYFLFAMFCFSQGG